VAISSMTAFPVAAVQFTTISNKRGAADGGDLNQPIQNPESNTQVGDVAVLAKPTAKRDSERTNGFEIEELVARPCCQSLTNTIVHSHD